jgi:hypothetical protein
LAALAGEPAQCGHGPGGNLDIITAFSQIDENCLVIHRGNSNLFFPRILPAENENLFIMTLSEKPFVAGAECLQNNNNGEKCLGCRRPGFSRSTFYGSRNIKTLALKKDEA